MKSIMGLIDLHLKLRGEFEGAYSLVIKLSVEYSSYDLYFALISYAASFLAFTSFLTWRIQSMGSSPRNLEY